MAQLVDRVRQALGIGPDALPLTLASETSGCVSIDPPAALQVCPEAARPGAGQGSVRGASQRRLVKQAALESPPPVPPVLSPAQGFYRPAANQQHTAERRAARGEDQQPPRPHRTAPRKAGGVFSMGRPAAQPPRRPGSWCGPVSQPTLDAAAAQACHADPDMRHSAFRVGDLCVAERCGHCGALREEYSDEELGLCIIVLGAFIHREPALAAPLLPEILHSVAAVAQHPPYPWQSETAVHVPGGATSVAHQFLRCVLHQLAPNGVFVQMFQTQASETARMQFFRSVAQGLQDFNELNPIAPLQLLLESLSGRRSLPPDLLAPVLRNTACYLDCLPLEAGLGPGAAAPLLQQMDAFFRRLVLLLPSFDDVTPALRVMVSVLKLPGVAACKSILEPFSKVMSYAIQNQVLRYNYIADLCFLCNRGFGREREKLVLTRTAVLELVQALKFKTALPDSNFIMLINIVLQDVGGSLALGGAAAEAAPAAVDTGPGFNTNASECMRHHLADALEFLADFHTLSKVKSYCKGLSAGLNEDTLGGFLKSGVAQYLALELARGGSRDSRALARYLPWLCTAAAPQQGPREFIDCVGHIRLLSWLLLGALSHGAAPPGGLSGSAAPGPCQPVPHDASCHIADHIQVVMAGFAEQSKASVLHMSALFHAFILCQLWTVYLEQAAARAAGGPADMQQSACGILLDFWGKVTPSVLQLAAHSRVLADMVNLHFLSLLEALQESESPLLSKLLPLWSPVLFACHTQLPGHLQVRLQACRDLAPAAGRPPPLLRWLHRLQFKMAQVELQSSAATQFYSV